MYLWIHKWTGNSIEPVTSHWEWRFPLQWEASAAQELTVPVPTIQCDRWNQRTHCKQAHPVESRSTHVAHLQQMSSGTHHDWKGGDLNCSGVKLLEELSSQHSNHYSSPAHMKSLNFRLQHFHTWGTTALYTSYTLELSGFTWKRNLLYFTYEEELNMKNVMETSRI